MNFRKIRSYNKAPCYICNRPDEDSKNHDQVCELLHKAHLNTAKHKFITTVRKDQIDTTKLRLQNNRNQSDEYYIQREEFERMKKLNNKKPWLDVRFHEKNKDYINYCNYCESFILDMTLNKHEQLDSHWQRFQIHFMNDLNNLLSKCKQK